MTANTNTAFLKEMGITEWTSRNEAIQSVNPVQQEPVAQTEVLENRAPTGIWWFFGSKPQGDAEQLFRNIIRALGLSGQEWSWKEPSEPINPEQLPSDGLPIVAIAFGGGVAQKLSGERDALPQLRETILAMDAQGLEELPLIASFELNHLLTRPKDKALLWQDLLLAKSVLQNL